MRKDDKGNIKNHHDLDDEEESIRFVEKAKETQAEGADELFMGACDLILSKKAKD